MKTQRNLFRVWKIIKKKLKKITLKGVILFLLFFTLSLNLLFISIQTVLFFRRKDKVVSTEPTEKELIFFQEINRLKSQLQASQSSLENSQSKLAKTLQSEDKLKEELAKIQKESQKLTELLNKSEAQNKNLKQSIKEKEKQAAELQRALNEEKEKEKQAAELQRALNEEKEKEQKLQQDKQIALNKINEVWEGEHSALLKGLKIGENDYLKDIVEDYQNKVLNSKSKEEAERFADECSSNVAILLNNELSSQLQPEQQK